MLWKKAIWPPLGLACSIMVRRRSSSAPEESPPRRRRSSSSGESQSSDVASPTRRRRWSTAGKDASSAVVERLMKKAEKEDAASAGDEAWLQSMLPGRATLRVCWRCPALPSAPNSRLPTPLSALRNCCGRFGESATGRQVQREQLPDESVCGRAGTIPSALVRSRAIVSPSPSVLTTPVPCAASVCHLTVGHAPRLLGRSHTLLRAVHRHPNAVRARIR